MNAASGARLILEIGAEGGSIKVLSRTNAEGTSEYRVQLRDQTLTFLSTDEAGPEVRKDSVWTGNWDTVIKALGRWPWPMLYPMYVHPDYRERIFLEVGEYRRPNGRSAEESTLDRWREACRPGVAP